MNNTIFDTTIVGVSTAYGRGAISIVRMSGREAIEIANKVFDRDLNKAKSHTVIYGHIYNKESNEIIDEVILTLFKAPKSYTKEDVVEINCHGGIYITNRILELLVINGATLAEAGEFTKRAFINGRIDLTKAEAVMDLIDAENKTALKFANKELQGSIYNTIEKLRIELLNIISIIEVNIDYPEYDDVAELTNNEIKPALCELKNKLIDILKSSYDVQKLKNGIDTVIIGQPNVGKSSLLNALLRENKAIVTPIPGTTRDTIEAKLHLGSLMLNLIDTAGLRDTIDEVEKIGVARAKAKIDQAELILLIIDGSKPLDENDYELLETTKNRKRLVIVNKSDLELKVNKTVIPEAIYISSLNNDDILLLEDKVRNYVMINDVNTDNVAYVGNARQTGLIKESLNSIEEALEQIKEGLYIDFVEFNLRKAWNFLGAIIGNVNDEDLINELFARFCLGK